VAKRKFINSGSPWEIRTGYSRAVVDGDWIFVAGTVGMNFKTLKFPPSVEAQTEQALDTIEKALKDAKASMLDVVRVRVYAARREYVPKIGPILKRRLGPAKAANTTVVCDMAVAAAKVEIEVTALKRRKPRRR
jgi:enamine deaminase RidA (YjgF/YER057c/UK114 family)